MTFGTVFKYLAFVAVGLLGAGYRRRRKAERFGELVGIGKTLRPRLPLLQLIDLASSLVISLSFIIASSRGGDYLFSLGYTVSMLLYGGYAARQILKELGRVYVYKNGIEIGGEEIHQDAMLDFSHPAPGRYLVKRKRHRDIEFELVEDYLSDQGVDKDEIVRRLFPKVGGEERP